jgi:hypothetical protein
MGFGLGAALVGALLAAGPTGVVPIAPSSPREAFERGRTAFERAEYKRAIDILSPLLYPDRLLESEGEQVAAYRMLGISYLFENKQDDARREFINLLRLRHQFRFDPLIDSERVVTFFDTVLKEHKEELEKIRKIKEQKDAATAAQIKADLARLRAPPTIVRYERHSFTVAFIPFGAGQFQNGERRKGWWFLGAESALAAISVGAFVTNFALYGVSPERPCNARNNPDGVACPASDIDHSQEETSRWLTRVQVGSGVAFFAVAVWGIVDAVRNFKQEVPLDTNGTNGANGARAGAPPLSDSFRLTLSSSGIGAAWTF